MWMTASVRSVVTLSVLVACFGLAAGCYGPFNLTKTIYNWNGQVQGAGQVEAKWMREGIFVALVLIPVYPISVVADALVFNSIEFWTGQNPIKVSREEGRSLILYAEEPVAALTFAPDGRSASVAYFGPDRMIRGGMVEEQNHRYVFTDETGRRLSEAELSDTGEIRLIDGNCRLLASLAPVPVLNPHWAADRLGAAPLGG